MELVEISSTGYLTWSLVGTKSLTSRAFFSLDEGHLWCSPRYCTWTSSVPCVYQQCYNQCKVKHAPVCRWQGQTTGLFTMKKTRNKLSVISTCCSSGVKIGSVVSMLINVRFYVSPMREILLAILTSYLVVHFNLSTKLLIWGSHWLLIHPGTAKCRKL